MPATEISVKTAIILTSIQEGKSPSYYSLCFHITQQNSPSMMSVILAKCSIKTRCMKEQVSKQTVVSTRNVVVRTGIIFTLPLLLLYFGGTNDEVCGGLSGKGILSFSPSPSRYPRTAHPPMC